MHSDSFFLSFLHGSTTSNRPVLYSFLFLSLLGSQPVADSDIPSSVSASTNINTFFACLCLWQDIRLHSSISFKAYEQYTFQRDTFTVSLLQYPETIHPRWFEKDSGTLAGLYLDNSCCFTQKVLSSLLVSDCIAAVTCLSHSFRSTMGRW